MTALTGIDRWAIGRARELAALTGDAVRARAAACSPLADGNGAFAYVLGEAQPILQQLADLAERLDGGDDQAAEDTRRLDRIRVVLAKFDWEHDDRQLALEAIERIAEGGQA